VLPKRFVITTKLGGDVKEKEIVQGFGNVGLAAAFYLAEMGAKLLQANRQRWRFNKRKWLYFEEIRALFLSERWHY
jgi:glutamate dehydrogenase/leucine dehydrogenase